MDTERLLALLLAHEKAVGDDLPMKALFFMVSGQTV